MKHTDVTIVVPSLSRTTHVLSDRALHFFEESIKDTFQGEVIIAWNGEGTGYPQGQCWAVNDAARRVKTPWMMVSNNDQVYPPGWFETFTRVVERDNLLVASPNLVEPQKGAPPFLVKQCYGLGVVESPPNFNKQCFLDFVETQKVHTNMSALPTNEEVEDGFNLPFLIRKDVWDTIGGYDEAYDPWGSNSDSDLQYKILLAGITPKRVRSVLVYHFSQTSGTFHPSHQDAWQKNFEYFTKKWGVQRANSPEIWYKPDISKVTYHPEWEGKYATH